MLQEGLEIQKVIFMLQFINKGLINNTKAVGRIPTAF